LQLAPLLVARDIHRWTAHIHLVFPGHPRCLRRSEKSKDRVSLADFGFGVETQYIVGAHRQVCSKVANRDRPTARLRPRPAWPCDLLRCPHSAELASVPEDLRIRHGVPVAPVRRSRTVTSRRPDLRISLRPPSGRRLALQGFCPRMRKKEAQRSRPARSGRYNWRADCPPPKRAVHRGLSRVQRRRLLPTSPE
jgi:hypothetical protein